MSAAGNLFNLGAGYLLGEEGQRAYEQLGQQSLQAGQQLGQQAIDASAFKPYTVTSSLANVQTTPEGGFNLNLSPEQQAMQTQLSGQSQSMFGQIGQDPAQAQAALYEQMRATQRPEEERQRLQMQEGLFSSGRGGVQTAMYGGTPEQMAYEKARQESMLNANLAARTQSQAEQLQAGQLGGMLQTASYQPQQQALNMLEGSQIPAGYLSQGQRTGAELQAKLGSTGQEGYINSAELGQNERLARLSSMAGTVGGGGNYGSGMLSGLDQYLPDWLMDVIGGSSSTPVDGGGVYVNAQGEGYNPAPQSYIDSLNTPYVPAAGEYNPYA